MFDDRMGRIGLTILVLLLLVPAFVFSQNQSSISGKITDEESGIPLSFANITLKGTPYGAFSFEDGTYRIDNVPLGNYTLQVTYIGYEPKEMPITVTTTERMTIDVSLAQEILELGGTEVLGERAILDRELNSSTRVVDAEEIDKLPVENLEEVLELQPGLVRTNEQISVRGARPTDSNIIIDGVSTRDPLIGGNKTLNIASSAIEELVVKTGGFAAEYGQATSGVITVRTKDGGDEFHGLIRYKTDEPFDKGFNSDDVEVTMSGPLNQVLSATRPAGFRLPGRLSYLFSAKTSLSDTYLPSVNKLKTRFFGGSFSPRQDNDWSALFKLTWKPDINTTLRASFSKTLAIDQGYERNIFLTRGSETSSPSGFRNSFCHFDETTGECTGIPDHANTFSTESTSFNIEFGKLVNPDKSTLLELQLSRFKNIEQQDVLGKDFTEFEELIDLDGDGFWDVGDDVTFHNRLVDRWTLKGSLETVPNEAHKIKFGGEINYSKLQLVLIENPFFASPTGLGLNSDIFTVHPVQGAFYVQDTIDFISLLINVGFRLDYWFPGELVDRVLRERQRSVFTRELIEDYFNDTVTIFGHQAKVNYNPRLAISHPITENDVVFFNFAISSKVPEGQRVYAQLTTGTATAFALQGNPNLDPVRTVQFEFGLRHKFSPNIVGGVTLFNRDDFGRETLTTVQPPDPSLPSFQIFLNSDFARTRGFELFLRQKRLNHLQTSVDFAFNIAKGKSSLGLEALAVATGSVEEVNLGEDFLSFNRPVKFTLTADYRFFKNEHITLFGLTLPDRWGVNMVYDYTSGRRYTPFDVENQTADFDEFSELGPSRQNVNLTLNKWFEFYGTTMTFGLEVRNLLDRKNVRRLDPRTGKAPVPAEPGEPTEPFNQSEFNVLSTDPSKFEEPRQVAIFISSEF